MIEYQLEAKHDILHAHFHAMASPCELLIDTQDMSLAHKLCQLAVQELARIERKFSRYRPDNVLWRINNAQGSRVKIDPEIYHLLQFADQCYRLSKGLFDITSGVYRRCWTFDGSDRFAEPNEVQALRAFVAWSKVRFDRHYIQMPNGFELDFGGIGKEYAVDKIASICFEKAPKVSVLVNFGGDIQISRPRINNTTWQVGIDSPLAEGSASAVLNIKHGALATSGDANRYLLKDGIRYSHIINPRTGMPVSNAPRSVTVAAPYCTQAGLLATLAILNASNAESFLAHQDIQYWCYW